MPETPSDAQKQRCILWSVRLNKSSIRERVQKELFFKIKTANKRSNSTECFDCEQISRRDNRFTNQS